MNHVLAGQSVCTRELCLTKPERGELGAFRVKLCSRNGMYGEIYATIADHFFVGSVNDGVDTHFSNILSNYL